MYFSRVMAGSDELLLFIKGMSKAEKRFFKLHASGQQASEDKQYLRLFDIYNKYSKPKELEAKIASEDLNKHLSWARNRLFQHLLSSMRTFHASKTKSRELTAMVQDVELLYQRRIYGKGAKELVKAKALATKLELFNELLTLIELESRMAMERQEKHYREKVKGLEEEGTEVLRKIKLLLDLRGLKNELLVLVRDRHALRDEEKVAKLEALMGAVPLKLETEKDGFMARHIQLYIQAVYHQLKGEFDQAYQQHHAAVNHWRSHPHMMEAHSNTYRLTCYNFMATCHNANQYEGFPEAMDEFLNLPILTPNGEAEVFQNGTSLNILYLMNTGKMKEAVDMVPQIEKGLKKYGEKINKSRRLTFYYNISSLYFLCGQFANANLWNEKIIGFGATPARRDLRGTAEIFRLLINYEAGETDYLESLLSSSYVYLKRNQLLFSLEKMVIRRLRAFIVSGIASVPKAEWESFLDELMSKQEQEQEPQRNTPILGVLDVWVQSKIQNRTMEEIHLENLNLSQ